MSIGKTILNVRKEKGMSQEEFGELFHVTRQTVSNWENEKNYPDLNTLVTMSDMFEISLDKLLKEDKQ
ncbi:XRE family transcriptional regulator, partial [Lachnoclostridium sp. An169]